MSYGANVPLDVVAKALNDHLQKGIEESVRRHLNEAFAPIFDGVVKDMTTRIHAAVTHWEEHRDITTGKSTVQIQLVLNGVKQAVAGAPDGN